jgi:hypothetical protein
MAKNISYNIRQTLIEVDKVGDYSTILANIEWNGKKSKGLDVRHIKDGVPLKGIAISHEGWTPIVDKLIEIGYGTKSKLIPILSARADTVEKDDTEELEEIDIEETEPVAIVNFDNIFSRVRVEKEKYTRDRFGTLRDETYRAVILKRNKKE